MHLGRVCPCHVQILDPKRKIIVLYHEDYVVLPTRTNMRVDNKSIAQEARSRTQPDDTSLCRWSPSQWLNTLLEKHAWFSAGLVWVQGASMSADVGVYDDSPPGDSTQGPLSTCLNIGKKVRTRPRLPMQGIIHSLSHWLYRSHGCKALSLSDAINDVSQHDESPEHLGLSVTHQADTRSQLPKST